MPTLSLGELTVRIVLAIVLGGAIGFEREWSGQSAGFRTHILVTLGAALFTLAGAYGLEDFFGEGRTVTVDPTRIAAQVVTGIGFLGAGAIIQRGINARGLTTAAALWVAAAIGVAIGLGYLVGAIATAVASIIVLAGLKFLERIALVKIRGGAIAYKILVHSDLRMGDIGSVVEGLGGRLQSLKIFEAEAEGWSLAALVRLPSGVPSEHLVNRLRALPGVIDVDTEL
jgi:putative Mg2+ transporter-C (MgtC) family protein